MSRSYSQPLALSLIVILLVNMILLGMGKISELVFWLTVAAIAGFMWWQKRKNA